MAQYNVKQAGGVGYYTTIQAAVNAAAAAVEYYGAVIEIQDDSTYNEAVNVTRNGANNGWGMSLTVRAQSGKRPVLSGAGGLDYAFCLNTLEVPGAGKVCKFEGLKFSAYNGGDGSGKGVIFCQGQPVHLTDCEFASCLSVVANFGSGNATNRLKIDRCKQTGGAGYALLNATCDYFDVWNCLVRPSTGRSGIATVGGAGTSTIYNNTVVVAGLNAVAIAATDASVLVKNNVVVTSGGGSTNGISAPTHSYNISHGFVNPWGAGGVAGTGDLTSDPLFVDPGGGDFQLLKPSPAVDSATSLAASFTVDILGVTRPQGSAWDRGCYEYVPIVLEPAAVPKLPPMAPPPSVLDASAVSESCKSDKVFDDVPEYDLYEGLARGVRMVDEVYGTAFLRRLLEYPSAVLARFAQKTHRVMHLLDPIACPDSAVRLLASHVGFGEGSGLAGTIADKLDVVTLRKLVVLAVAYWRARGTEGGLQDAILTLTGVRPAIDSWFVRRALLDEGLIGSEGGPGTDLGWTCEKAFDGSDGADMLVEIHVATQDAMLQDLVLDLCQLAIPVGEHYEVSFPDFLDTFHDDVIHDVWHTVAGAAPTLITPATVPAAQPTDPPSYTYAGLQLAPGSAVRAINSVSSTWLPNRIQVVVWNGNATDEIKIAFCCQQNADDDRYELTYNAQPGGPTGPTLLLHSYIGGNAAEIGTNAPLAHDCTGPAPRMVWIDFVATPDAGNHRRFRVWVDADLAFDSTPGLLDAPFTHGAFGVKAPGTNTAAIRFHRVELWEAPMRSVIIDG